MSTAYGIIEKRQLSVDAPEGRLIKQRSNMTPGSVEAQRASVGAVDSPELKCGAWNINVQGACFEFTDVDSPELKCGAWNAPPSEDGWTSPGRRQP